MVVRFENEVVLGGKSVLEIDVRKVKVKDIKNASNVKGGSVEQDIWLMSALIGASIAEIEELEVEDYLKIKEANEKKQSQNGVNA
jgi:hypothetical protein